MGFKQADVVYPGSNGVSAASPVAKDGSLKMFQLSRTETTGVLKAVLPGDSTILGFLIYGAASDAGTSANISIGSNVTATQYVNAQDVKTAGGLVIPTSSISTTNLPNLENTPITGDVQIWAKYAESGTVSTVGGPWKIAVWYVR